MNGKSALFGLLRDIMAPFYLTAHKDLYIKPDSHRSSSAGGAEPHKVALKRKRLAVLQETGADDKLVITTIKQFVDDNEIFISARDLYEKAKGQSMEFQVVAKHCILTNNILGFRSKPGDTGGTDPEEVAQRLRRGEHCKPADRDAVGALRTTHLSQVFSFFVEGAMAWYRNGQRLPRPKEVIDATHSTLADNDRVQQFIDHCCEVGKEVCVAQTILHRAYEQWWQENIQEPGMQGPKKFGDVLCKSKGFTRDREYVGKQRVRVYKGLRLKEK